MSKPKVDRHIYTGLCVGGPMAATVINSVGDRDYRVAKMTRFPFKGYPINRVSADDPVEWTETRRGLYQYDVGIWWWRGWEKQGAK